MAHRLNRLLKWCEAVIVAAALGATAAADSVLVTDPGGRRVRNNGSGDYEGALGYDFQVGSADARVTHLGVWDGPGNEDNPDAGEAGDGLEHSAIVGIYRVSDQELIAEATVPAGAEGQVVGEFRYVSLDEPVTLSADGVYRIVMGVDRGGNAFRNYIGGGDPAPTVSEHFAVGNVSYFNTRGSANQLLFVNHQTVGSIYVGPNFRYTGGGAILPPDVTEQPGDRLADAESRPGRLIVAEGFENGSGQDLPDGWTLEPATGSGVLTAVEEFGAGNAGRALKISHKPRERKQDAFGGLTYRFAEPADRIALAFDFKAVIGYGPPPALEIYTLGPDSTEPTQLHLRIRNVGLEQYGGIHLGWVRIPYTPWPEGQLALTEPWYRVRLVIDRNAQAIEVYLSEPDSPELPSPPVAVVPANGIGDSIAAIRFAASSRPINYAWIDNLTVHVGGEITTPGTSAAAGEPELKPDLSEGHQLWTGETFPRSFGDIHYPQGIAYHLIQERTRPWHWFHGTAIEAHEGELYASWGANAGGENRPGEVVLFSTSSDGGKTWSEAEILADGDGKGGTEYSNSHGTLLSHDGRLWGFFQHWAGGWDNPLSTEAFILNEETAEWESKGIVATQGWPLDRPKQTANGDWIMGVSGFRMQRPGVMVSDGDNLLKWNTVAIPTGRNQRFPETSVIVDGNDVTSITRWNDGRALVSTSSDGGQTWADARPSNLPMVWSKPDSGVLSTGQWFVIVNMQDRDALMIAVGKPGEKGVSKLYKVRYGAPPTRFDPTGPPRGGHYAYPYAMEHDGKLYVSYSVNKADVEVAIIPIDSLKAGDPAEWPVGNSLPLDEDESE